MVGHNVRRTGFEVLDFIRGGRVNRALSRVGKIMESRQVGDRYAAWAIQRLLEHARTTTEMYRECPPGCELAELPVIDKSFIRENTSRMISVDYGRADLTVASTSGSTGTPLRVYQDAGKRFWRNVDTLYFGSLLGFEVGMRLYNLKIWSARNQQAPWRHVLRNTRPVDVVNFDQERVADFLADLSSLDQPAAIISYSSALDQLAAYLDRNAEAPRPRKLRAIIAQSEPLSIETRSRIGARLGVFPTSRYGMEEVGIIAQEGDDWMDGYRINRAGVHVEILELGADVPVETGEVGRIVVTDLHNLGMPIIRYDTGDVGRFVELPNGDIDKTRLAAIEGRLLDQITDSGGRHVSPFVFYKSVWKYPTIRQFQLAQLARSTYELRLQVDDSEFDAESIALDFRQYLGENADFRVKVVDNFPVLDSGKRRQVVNEIHRH